MAKATKDQPLLLVRQVTSYDDDGKPEGSTLGLQPGSDFPHRHEFGWDWLAKTPEATFDPVQGTIKLELTNGSATYQTVDSVEVDGEQRTSFAGVWAEKVGGKN
jgi:hypothetical protein